MKPKKTLAKLLKRIFFLLMASGVVFLTTGIKASETHKDITAELAYTNHLVNDAMMQQQQVGRFGATPEDSVACIRALSLYQEFFGQRNFAMAYDPWRQAIEVCPKSSPNLYIRGTQLVKMKYNEETDLIKRDAWIDTLMLVYDMRIEHFGREGFVTGRKAVDLYQLRPNAVLDVYELTRKSVELEGKESSADVIIIKMNSLIQLVQAGLKDASEVVEAYDRLMDLINYNLSQEKDVQFFNQAKNNIDLMFEPFASCENIITIYGPRFEENPEDLELLERITSMLDKSNCTSEELFFKATKNLHRIQPTAESAFLMARMESNNQNWDSAMGYYKEAVDLYDNDEDKFRALMLKADISYRQLRQFNQARTLAIRASKLQPENGRPYIFIGEMYAASASTCGDDDLTKSVTYWAAVDKFVQARNVDTDPQIQERATQLINTYSQYFPNNEVIFFHGLTEGETFRVECWINETTRVRAR